MGTSGDRSFWGESEHSVDDKGRLILPKEYRAMLGDECVLARGPDHVVLIFGSAVWSQLETRLYGDVLGSPSRIMQRLFSSRQAVRIDARARISIPKVLRDWAGIEVNDRIVLLGQGQSIEVWSHKNWAEYQKTFTAANTLEAASQMGLGDLFKL
jgi:MraZ protein